MLIYYLFIDVEDRSRHDAAYLEVACISNNKTHRVDLSLVYMHNLHPGANLLPGAKLHPGVNLHPLM